MSENSMDDIFLQAMKAEDTKKNVETDSRSKIVKGVVIALSGSDVFLEMGGKSEAVVPLSEFETPPVVGDNVDVVLKDMKDGVNVASKIDADNAKKVNDIRKAAEEGLAVTGRIESVVKKDGVPKGFTVDLGTSLKAFLPLSQMDTRKVEKPEELIGTKTEFAILEMRRNNITVSRREYLSKTIKKLYTVFFEKHQVGDVIRGSVERVEENFLVLSAEGIRAFMYVGDFSWKYLADLRKVVQLGDEMDVQVIALDPAKNSVKVGKKQLMADPWTDLAKKYNVGDVVKGKVISYRREGAMIEVEDGVEAFLHVEEMSWTEKVRDPKRYVKLGDIVEVKIKNIDLERRRMDLSLKENMSNPWFTAAETYTYGRKLTGMVSSVVDFGVFVRFEDGIEGLMRREDADWADPNADLKKLFKKGDSLEVVVLSLDAEKERLRVGLKQLSENPYKAFSLNYPKGAPVTGTVKEIQENGVMLTLPGNVEGFVHVSQMAKDKIEKPSDAAQVGDEMKVLVKYVDLNKNKIELSRKEFLNTEEKREVEKYKSGTTGEFETPTIGSLLKDSFDNLKVGKKNGK